MKICFLTQNLYTLGGIQRVVTTLLNELVKNAQYEIVVLMPFKMDGKKLFFLDSKIQLKDMDLLLEERSQSLARYILTANKRIGFLNHAVFNKLITAIKFSSIEKARFIDYINSEKFDVTVSAGIEFSLLLGEIAPMLECKTVGWQHSTFDAYFKCRGKDAYGLINYTQTCFSQLNQVWVLTKEDKKIFDATFDICTHVFYNPLPHKKNIKSTLSNPNIIFVGRLNKKLKGLEYLLEIIKTVSWEEPKARFQIVGDGPDRKWLESAICDMKLCEKVDVVGNTDNVYQYYANASILLQPSRAEGFGMTVLEAMSCGVPVVAFHNNGPDEIISDKKDGFLIEKYDLIDYTDKVLMLLNDYELRRDIGKNAIEKAKCFDLEILLPQFEDMLSM